MDYEMKDMTFTMFTNKYKKTDKHPDYTGDIKIDGKIMRIACWEKLDKNKNTFLSGSIEIKDESKKKDTPFNKNKTEEHSKENLDDSIPF